MTDAPRFGPETVYDKDKRERMRQAVKGWPPHAHGGHGDPILSLLDACDYLQAKLDAADAAEDQMKSVIAEEREHHNKYATLCAEARQILRVKLDESVAREAALVDDVRAETWRAVSMAVADGFEKDGKPYSANLIRIEANKIAGPAVKLSDAARELLEKARRCDRAVDDLIKASNERDAYRADAEKWRKEHEPGSWTKEEAFRLMDEARAERGALQRENAALRDALKRCKGGTPTSCYSCHDALAQLDAEKKPADEHPGVCKCDNHPYCRDCCDAERKP